MFYAAIYLITASILGGFTAGAADETKKSDEQKGTCHLQAVVTRIDTQKNALTVQTSDKNGKQIEKTFNLSSDVKCFDAGGHECNLSNFKAGDDVCITQDGDKITEVRKHARATITKVDPEHSTITVRLTDKDGKSIEKTFRLVEDTSYVDGNGRVEILNAFQSGDEILFVQANGMIKGLKKPVSKK